MHKNNEYIAYHGDFFTIEWYFDHKDQSQAFDYYQSLNADEQIKLLKLFKNEKEKALNTRDNYISRTQAGEYYD